MGRSDYSKAATEMGATFVRSADALCDAYPDVLLLCTSIVSAQVTSWIPISRVLSVKVSHNRCPPPLDRSDNVPPGEAGECPRG